MKYSFEKYINMKRRSAIKLSLGTLGFCLSGVTLTSLVCRCKTDHSTDWVPGIFSSDQSKLVERLVDIIIPATSRGPGAAEALVHRYLDEAVATYFSERERTQFFNILTEIDTHSNDLAGKSFVGMDEGKQLQVVTEWAESSDDFKPTKPGDEHSFLLFRRLTKHAFFTSEVGCKQVLNYDPIPGGYSGCIDLPENGAGWARLAG